MATVWFFRAELARTATDLLSKGLLPALGTVALGWALYCNGRDPFAKDYGLTSLLGIGGVFVIGVATLVIGVLLMVAWNLRAPSFFRGETFTPEWAAAREPELVRD